MTIKPPENLMEKSADSENQNSKNLKKQDIDKDNATTISNPILIVSNVPKTEDLTLKNQNSYDDKIKRNTKDAAEHYDGDFMHVANPKDMLAQVQS